MKTSLRFVGLSGSLRQESYSSAVLDMVGKQLLPRGYGLDVLNIGDFPHYNQDLEESALPEVVALGRSLVAQSDGVVIVTPEFNHGIPGVLKNTLDWLSRPAFASCFHHKPVLFCTISPGALGGVRAQYQLRETLSSMLCKIVPMPEIVIPHVNKKFENGIFSEKQTLDFVSNSIDRFINEIKTSRTVQDEESVLEA
ncbi:Quinone reductase (plasmid) [Caballeronia sp. SBC1]|uniref:NADPH-dependent FMN reductase n=1 Tax=unclassified Caballeronia TaxID=2646786 RepID=UPI0013E19824|nr:MULTISPECIES: NADPH-dependent FMN reductase [unclassified Caballeronia]QIE28116.1 Quinone reductase [Caballeronia sp. SBC2]QIN66178.1 Quinone reductase [Caballeronia sp. SBC1]